MKRLENKKETEILGSETLLLDEKAAAKRYSLPISRFQQWRHRQEGPPWIKLKRSVLYPIQSTDSYFLNRMHQLNQEP